MAGSLTAVVCDDDAFMRRLATRELEREGFRIVAECDRAWAAVQIAQTCPPDVLVLDLSLPDFSGEQAFSTIRQAAPDCTVVIWSGYESSTDFEADGAVVSPKATAGLGRTLAAVRAARLATRAAAAEVRAAHEARRVAVHRPRHLDRRVG